MDHILTHLDSLDENLCFLISANSILLKTLGKILISPRDEVTSKCNQLTFPTSGIRYQIFLSMHLSKKQNSC